QVEGIVEDGDVGFGGDAAATLAEAGALLHQAEGGAAVFVESDDVAVEDRGLGAQQAGQVVQVGVLRGKVVLVAGHETQAGVFEEGDGAGRSEETTSELP